MSLQNTIPVIGVPPSLIAPAAKPAKPVVQKPKPQQVPDAVPSKAHTQLVIRNMVKNLTHDEQLAYYAYVKHYTKNNQEFQELSNGQKKKTRAECRLEFLLNKDDLMKEWRQTTVKKVNPPAPLKKKNKERKRKEKNKAPEPNGSPAVRLMEKVIEAPTPPVAPIEYTKQLISSTTLPPKYSEYQTEPLPAPNRGYQYLNSDWLQPSYSSQGPPTTSADYSTYPNSSTYSFPSNPSVSSYSQQPNTNGYTPLLPSLLTEANKLPPQSFYGQYSSQSYQPHQQDTSSSSGYPTILPSPSPATAAASSAHSSESPLDFEAAVAMQQRLLQIDQELQDIERQKMEMAMADKLRRREEELREKEMTLARRERELQMRSAHRHMKRRSRSRSRERDRRYEYPRGGRSDHYQPEPQRSTYLNDYSSRPSTYQPSSQTTYNSSEIRIKTRDRLREERDADAARRHGQKRRERRDGGEPLPGGQEAKRRGSSSHLVSSYRSGLPPQSRYSPLETEEISDDEY